MLLITREFQDMKLTLLNVNISYITTIRYNISQGGLLGIMFFMLGGYHGYKTCNELSLTELLFVTHQAEKMQRQQSVMGLVRYISRYFPS